MTACPHEYAEFIRLFNEQRFFEAHEALELLWRREMGPARDFYHGLIQMAAVFVHLARSPESRGLQAPAGARRLLETARKYLKPYLPVYAGLDAAQFLIDTENAVQGGKVPVLNLKIK